MTDPLVDALETSRRLGFLGPGPVEEHLQHALAFASAITEPPARALDLGAGGGLPGLVLAARVWPDTSWTFLDAHRRRTAFLVDAVTSLGLDARVSVVTARAEEAGRNLDQRGRYDLVVARSFAAPAITAECAAPLLALGGALVVSEPPDPDGSDRWPDAGLAMLGLGPARPVVVDGVHLVRMTLAAEPPDRYPRRVGIPAKRPLF